jgi:hypothetical protein
VSRYVVLVKKTKRGTRRTAAYEAAVAMRTGTAKARSLAASAQAKRQWAQRSKTERTLFGRKGGKASWAGKTKIQIAEEMRRRRRSALEKRIATAAAARAEAERKAKINKLYND